jgi:hypothetical protein
MKKNITQELVDLINYSRIKNSPVTDFGLFYKISQRDAMFIVTVGKKKMIDGNRRLEFLAENEEFEGNTFESLFNNEYEAIKYLLWVGFEIFISDIFNYETEALEKMDLKYYEKDRLNEDIRKILVFIKRDEELEKMDRRYRLLSKDMEKDIENNYFPLEGEPEDIKSYFIKSVYDESKKNINNTGMAWDNITNFSILGYSITEMKNTDKRRYALNVRFQIESFLEEKNIFNYYEVEIPAFMNFICEIENEDDETLLRNNLRLLYNLDENLIYKMIIDEFDNFKNYKVEPAQESEKISINDFKYEVLSKLAKYMPGIFCTGSKNVFTISDIEELSEEFMKRSFFDFKKHLFADFALSNIGLKINDINTVSSFYQMIEKIAEKYSRGSN